jgi:serine/threonine-protein kinase RsbW
VKDAIFPSGFRSRRRFHFAALPTPAFDELRERGRGILHSLCDGLCSISQDGLGNVLEMRKKIA